MAIVVNAGFRETDRAADVLTMRYLRWVDELEPEHIELLRLAGPRGDFAEVSGYLALVRRVASSARCSLRTYRRED